MLGWWELSIPESLKRIGDKHDEQVQKGQRVCVYLLYGSVVQIITSSDGMYVACCLSDHVQQRYGEGVRKTAEQVIQELLERGGRSRRWKSNCGRASRGHESNHGGV